MSPVGGEPYMVEALLYSNPPKSDKLNGKSAIKSCQNLARINVLSWKPLELLNNERVQRNSDYFYRKYLHMIESNTLGTYSEAKREISGQINTIINKNSLCAIETAICCLEGILLIFSDIPKKKNPN